MKRFTTVCAILLLLVPIVGLAAPPPAPQSDIGVYSKMSQSTDPVRGAVPCIEIMPAPSPVLCQSVYTDVIGTAGAQEVAFNVICPIAAEPSVQNHYYYLNTMTETYNGQGPVGPAPNISSEYGTEQAAVANYSYYNWKVARDCV